jgi:hypothetical protein
MAQNGFNVNSFSQNDVHYLGTYHSTDVRNTGNKRLQQFRNSKQAVGTKKLVATA